MKCALLNNAIGKVSHTIHKYSDMFHSFSNHPQGVFHPTSIYKTDKLSEGLDLTYFIIHLCFYIHLFDVRLPEDDMKKIKTCQRTSELYLNVCILILVHLLVLSIKMLQDIFI